MLFIDYRFAFNTISPLKLIALNIEPALSEWVLHFLLGRTLFVEIWSTQVKDSSSTQMPPKAAFFRHYYTVYSHISVYNDNDNDNEEHYHRIVAEISE